MWTNKNGNLKSVRKMSMWRSFRLLTQRIAWFSLCTIAQWDFAHPSPGIGPDNLTIPLPAGKTARIVLEEALNKTVI